MPADEDGLAKLVLACGIEVKACVEMMSGSVWVCDQLAAVGWRVQVAHARKVRDVAPLACKTDKVDARVLAELCRRDLVPELWVPSLQDRALRERLRRRMHLVRMRASAQNRIFGLLTQWGLRLSVKQLREPDAGASCCSSGLDPPGDDDEHDHADVPYGAVVEDVDDQQRERRRDRRQQARCPDQPAPLFLPQCGTSSALGAVAARPASVESHGTGQPWSVRTARLLSGLLF